MLLLQRSLVVAAYLAVLAMAHPEYRQRIPNSMNVKGVDALGHVDPSGGGPRNAFGQDFASEDKKWTVALCQKDSDDDGQTNGQELGDPCCQWVQNTNEKVLWTTGVSAPGDAKSKSDPTLWASVTCASATPLSTSEGPTPSTGGASATPSATVETPKPSTGGADDRRRGVSAFAISAAVTVAVANVIGM